MKAVSILVCALVFVAIGGVLHSSAAQAAKSEFIELDGTVKSYDTKTVRILSGDSVWDVPREKVLVPGLAKDQSIRVNLKRAEFQKLHHEIAKAHGS